MKSAAGGNAPRVEVAAAQQKAPEFPPAWEVPQHLRFIFGDGPPRNGSFRYGESQKDAGVTMVVAFSQGQTKPQPDYHDISLRGRDPDLARRAWENQEAGRREGPGNLTVTLRRPDGSSKQYEGYAERDDLGRWSCSIVRESRG